MAGDMMLLAGVGKNNRPQTDAKLPFFLIRNFSRVEQGKSGQGKGWRLCKALAQTCILAKGPSPAALVRHGEEVHDRPPTFATFASLLKQCGEAKALDEGRLLHSQIRRFRYDRNTYLGNWLVRMYGDCGSMDDARDVFFSLPKLNCHSWNTLLKAYVMNGLGKEALECFDLMLRSAANPKPNRLTFLYALDACGLQGALEKGRDIHDAIVAGGYDCDATVGTTLICMYGRCGGFEDAKAVFERLPERDLVAWNAMITASAQTEHEKEALHLFDEMQRLHRLEPNRVTFVAALAACARLAALKQGREIHDAVAKSGHEGDVIVATALIDMYGKCGNPQEAIKIFLRSPKRNVASWNAMIAAYAHNGYSKEALDMFELMQCDGFTPDHLTSLSILTACRHTGQLDNATHYFFSMDQVQDMKPSEEQYLCFLDILSRSGHLDAAESLITGTSLISVARAWLSLLSGCRAHGDIRRGVQATKHVLELDPGNAALSFLQT